MKRNNNLSTFQLHFNIDFVLTERKLVKFPVRSISYFVVNIIWLRDWLNRQSKFRKMTYFQQSAEISSRQNFRLYGITFILYPLRMSYTPTHPTPPPPFSNIALYQQPFPYISSQPCHVLLILLPLMKTLDWVETFG